MSVQQLDQQAPSNEWLALVLRLSAFPKTPIEVPRKGWWIDLFGEEPDIFTYKKSMELQELGFLGVRQLKLSANPLRIDWQLTPPEPIVLPEEGLPSIGTLSQGLEIFLPLVFRWLEQHCPELQRLAFGAELLLPVADRSSGYRQLACYLPFEIDSEGVSDFLYQINRPRETRLDIPSLHINRLYKWNVVRMGIGGQIGAQLFDLPGIEQYACRLELDINTAPNFQGTLVQDQLRPVFQELVDLGTEIAAKGDIP